MQYVVFDHLVRGQCRVQQETMPYEFTQLSRSSLESAPVRRFGRCLGTEHDGQHLKLCFMELVWNMSWARKHNYGLFTKLQQIRCIQGDGFIKWKLNRCVMC